MAWGSALTAIAAHAAAAGTGSLSQIVEKLNRDQLEARNQDTVKWFMPISTRQIRQCTVQSCVDAVAAAFYDSLTAVEAARAYYPAFAMRQRVLGYCQRKTTELDRAEALNDCLKGMASMSTAARLIELGYSAKGISAAGYSSVEIGMSGQEVEFVLGSPGVQTSFIASGPYSLETRRYSGRSGSIIVTYGNGATNGKAQFGLR
jgi:hypothetical protein